MTFVFVVLERNIKNAVETLYTLWKIALRNDMNSVCCFVEWNLVGHTV
jgi:hypothetical protein